MGLIFIYKWHKAFFKTNNLTDPFVLCQRCYCHAYNTFHTKQSCKSCRAIPKAGVIFSWHTPNAQLVNKYWRTTVDSDILITSQDILCYSCYKMHSNIVKALKGLPDQQYDNELQHNINAWTTALNDEHTDALNKSIFSAVLFVAEHLRQQKAILLPWVCQVFLSTHCATGSSDLQ